ncbi:hypothetical protein [Paenibacillus ihumii]|uniref:hypothetical protein n=1 Tax=Paenibacillus ihumii TaxID=687436 RepID=UPI0006D775C1|nr:hypothetical protein [Paenibacillus ihumii]
MLQEFRCSKCNKLLGKIDGKAEIVCTRCKVLNEFNLTGKETLRYPAWYSEKFKEALGQFEVFCKANNISAASIIAMAHSELEGESQDDHETADYG